MTTESWELTENPSRFDDYNWYSDEVPARKFYLFLAEIGRRLRHLMTDPGPLKMIDFCEQCAEGQLTEDDLSDLSDEYRPGPSDGPYTAKVANNLFFWVADRYKVSSRGVFYAPDVIAYPAAVKAGLLTSQADFEQIETARGHPVFASVREGTEREWGALVRDIYGPDPFRAVAFDPAWRTVTVVALAGAMYESRDFAGMPILADALEEAGCTDAGVLGHCRSSEPHVRGCWLVDALLCKE